MLAVFRKDLRLFFRDRWALAFSVLMPIFVITVIAQALFNDDSGPKLLVPVVNEDGGPVANTFVPGTIRLTGPDINRDEQTAYLKKALSGERISRVSGVASVLRYASIERMKP